MKNNFKHGIISAPSTPSFLEFNSGNVNLILTVGDLLFTITHGSENYLYIESQSIPNAWVGPFSSTGKSWLYWDINLESGVRSFGHTNVNPFGVGATLPEYPEMNEHFFYTKENKLKLWNGGRWETVLRVFSGEVINNSSVVAYETGTQISDNSEIYAGYILYGIDGIPLKIFDNFNRGAFIHTEYKLNTYNSDYNQYEPRTREHNYIADTSIPFGYCIRTTTSSNYSLASYKQVEHQCIGVSITDVHEGESGKYVTEGILISDFWNFTEPPNTPVWVGISGELRATPPPDTSMQRIGYIISSNSIIIDIQDLILIDVAFKDCILPSNTPTPTPTPTMPVTPTVTVTPTVSG